jgi:hypothetical protein
MEPLQINIPQFISTKPGEFKLSLNDEADISEFIIHDLRSIDYAAMAKILKDIKSVDEPCHNVTVSSQDSENWSLIKKLYTYFNYKFNSSISVRYTIETPEKKEQKARLKLLSTYFKEEVNRYPHYISSNKENAFELFDNISSEVSKIVFSDSLVELTPNNTFKIKALLPNNELLVISKPFHDIDDLIENEVIFSLFRNKKCLISQAIDIVDLVKSINEYLDIK